MQVATCCYCSSLHNTRDHNIVQQYPHGLPLRLSLVLFLTWYQSQFLKSLFFFPATMTSTPTSSAAAESSEPATISPTAQMTSPTFSSSPATQPLSSAASISQQASSLSSQTMAASTTLPFMSMDPVISQTWMPPPLTTEFSAWNPPLFTWTPTQPSVRPPVQPVLSTGRSFLPPMESASNFAGPTFAGAPVGLFPESFTFERLRNCLIEKEQTIQYMRTLEEPPQAQAFAVQAQATGQPPPHGGQQQRGRGYRGRGGRGQRGRGGRGQRGRGYAPHQHGYGFPPPMGYGYPPPGYVPGGAPHAGILGAPGSAGSSSVDGHSVPPPVVCQICYAPGHPASTCPSRFVQPAAPALAAQAPDATDIVWYPDSGASAHMTPHPVFL
ncbi:unnamed protein product [Cuscuta epithymum]|uniref:Uncharacterized protein n=1 Tax=Cuscuta epithymum TaxID=186058 RepID=A0AAV0E1R0_9ASTE|nr:unnamed protein product [Cuscuta epithymum]